MASTYTNLGVELMATGENAGTWGTKTNANLNLAEQLLGGFKIQTLNAAGTGANTTALAIADGALTGAAQNRVIILGAVSPQAIAGNKIVTFPLLTETFYFIKNSTSGAYTVQLKAASGSGATVTFSATDKGYKVVYLDGVATNTGVIEVPLGSDGDVTLTGTQTLTNKTLTLPKVNNTTAITTTGTELNYSDLATLGTSAASKVLTADSYNLTKISGAVLNIEDTLTDASSIVWNVINSPVAKVTLTANRAMAAPTGTGIAAGQMISVLVIQDAGGTNELTWNAVYEFPSDTAPTLTSTGALGDIFSFRYNGAKWLLIGQTLALTLA